MIRPIIVSLALLALGPVAQALDLPSAIAPYRLGHCQTQDELLIGSDTLKAKVRSRPDSSQALLDLAEVEAQLGDIDQAIKHCRSAAGYAPNDYRTHLILAWLFLLDRNALAARLQAERALELMNKTADRTEALCLQIPALVDLKEYAKADKLSASEFKKNPKDARLSFLRGWVLAANHSKEAQDAAVGAYRQALSLDPSLNEAHYNLALLLSESNPKEAVAQLQEFLKAAAKSPKAKLAEDLMSKLAHQD